MDHKVVVRLFQITSEHFITTHREVDNIADSDVNDTEETLVLLLEFLLVKYLDRKNAVLIDSQVEWFIPVGIQSFLDHRSGMCLLSSDGGHGERIRESKDIALVQTVCSNNRDPKIWLGWQI
jgi:hypothetical protein